MKVKKSTVDEYCRRLAMIDQKCAEEIQAYMEQRRFIIDDDFIRYANAIQEKYGEAAAELSCQMYDELAASYIERGGRKVILPAEPAPTATMQETAKTVYGTAKKSLTEIPNAVSLLAKRAAQDTTLHNALRDGAEFAWIPSGDTCAFCRMLGSNGFRRMSKKVLRSGHAEHIHANCDCTYVVRFDSRTTYEGYDPDALYRDYKESGGLNGMARKIYADNKDEINARRRELYAERKTINNAPLL